MCIKSEERSVILVLCKELKTNFSNKDTFLVGLASFFPASIFYKSGPLLPLYTYESVILGTLEWDSYF